MRDVCALVDGEVALVNTSMWIDLYHSGLILVRDYNTTGIEDPNMDFDLKYVSGRKEE